MIKKFEIPFLLMFIISCRDSNPNLDKTDNYEHPQVRLAKASKELRGFDTLTVKLYDEAGENPETIIGETEKLIKDISMAIDSNKVRRNKLNSLHSLRAEIFYKLGEYKKSIDEIFLGVKNNVTLACNYLKLKDFEKAKSYIDSTGPGYYIYDYILGNYFEVTGNKKRALEAYKKIERKRSSKHYLHYNWAIERIAELQKSNPKFLDELYYPTENPVLKYAMLTIGEIAE